MKLNNGKTWYMGQLNDYTPEFLQEIIVELMEDKKRRKWKD